MEVGFQLQPWALAHVCVPCTLPVLGFSQALRNPHTFDIKALKIKFKNLSFLLYSLLPFHHLSSSIYLLVGQSFILVLPKLLKEKPNKPFGQPDICLSVYLPAYLPGTFGIPCSKECNVSIFSNLKQTKMVIRKVMLVSHI